MADVLSVIADVLKNDKQQKREHAKIMKEVQKKLKEKDSEEVVEEPGDKEDYMKFFAGKLKKYGVKSPAELSDEDKKKFFNEIEKDWKHDSSEEVEVEEKEEDLGKRVKSRMEAEDEEEDEDEAPVGDQDEPETEPEEEGEDEVDMDEPSEDQIDKIADLVVQKLKDKADEEEEEEQEPDSTEAEGGKEEDIDTEPKVENLHRNPHRKSVWLDALRKVHENTQKKTQQLDEHKGTKPHKHPHEDVEKGSDVLNEKGTAYPATIETLKKIIKDKQHQTVMFKSGQAIVDTFTASAMVAVYDAMKPATKKKFEEMIKDKGGFMKTQAFAMKMVEDVKWQDHIKEDPSLLETFGEEVEIDEGNDKPIEDAAKKVQHHWKRMSTRDKVKFKDKMDDLASKNRVSDTDLEEILDDYGLNEGKESIGMTFLRKHYSKDKQ